MLLTQPADTIAIPVATKHDPVGYYPTKYLVTWDESATEWRVALGGLQQFSE